jgi:peptidoglycan-associated lipoprotein
MKTRKTALIASAAAAVLLLAGCASKVDLNEAPVDKRDVPAAATSAAAAPTPAPSATQVQPQSRVATVDAGAQALAAANAAGRVVYFDFDSFALRPEFQSLVDAHGRALVASRNRSLVVEGHTDERGGREYNLALGQKRAEAVLRALAAAGAQPQQLEAVSFGKERPAANGNNEEAWAKNRRAELRDR